MEPKRLTAHIASGNAILIADVLQLGDELWIVSRWLETQDGQWRTPEIAIRMDRLPHQKSGAMGTDLTLSNSIPKAVLDGDATSAEGIEYEVLKGPADRFGWIRVPRAN